MKKGNVSPKILVKAPTLSLEAFGKNYSFQHVVAYDFLTR